MPIPLKLLRCLGNGLKISVFLRYNPQTIFFLLFSQNEHSHICGQRELILGILCMRLLLQFYADFFDTLQISRPWSEGVHIIWI